MPTLPKGWIKSTAKEACSVVVDCHNKTAPYQASGIKLIRTTNVRSGTISLDNVKFVDLSTYEYWSRRCKPQPGDIIFTREAPMAEAGMIPAGETICMGQRMMLLRTDGKSLLKTYLLYALQAPFVREYVDKNAVGTGVKHLRVKDVEGIPLRIAPLAEQHRIVNKIEELFTELDAGVALLKKLKIKLKRYRQSVLKAAVEGKLTQDWRESHQDELEPASVLLERILAERREKWEAEQLAKMEAKGKVPQNDKWKLKYKEPTVPDTAALSPLPKGWQWITLGAMLFNIEAGKSFTCEGRPPTHDEVGVAKVSAVSWGEYNELESKVCIDQTKIKSQFFIQPHDFLFSRANTIDLVGACVIVKRVERQIMLSDKTLRLHFIQLPSEWFLITLRSRHGRDEIERLATGNQDSMGL